MIDKNGGEQDKENSDEPLQGIPVPAKETLIKFSIFH
jgi:hypothetical protein